MSPQLRSSLGHLDFRMVGCQVVPIHHGPSPFFWSQNENIVPQHREACEHVVMPFSVAGPTHAMPTHLIG